MAVVNVSDVKARALSGETAGAESGHTALMGQLGQRVCLVHELAQRRGAEELLDSRGHGADIDKALGRDNVQILKSHTLADNSLHTAEADTELILQQLADTAYTAVAQMVYIVGLAYTVAEAVEVVDGGENIVGNDVLGNENVDILTDGVFKGLALVLLAQLLHNDAADLFPYAELGGVEVHIAGDVDHAVGEHTDGLAVDLQQNVNDAGVGYLARLVTAEDLAGIGKYLTGEGVRHGSGQLKAGNTREEGELLIKLIAADVGDLVAAAVIEQTVEQALRGLHGGRIAGAQLAVYLQKALFAALAGILVQSGNDTLVLAKDFPDALIVDDADIGILHAAEPGGGTVLVVCAHGLDKPGDRELAVLVYADIEHVVCVGLILKPGTVVRDNGGGVGVDHGLVGSLVKVHTGGTDDLGDDDTLGAVDDKGTAVGHERKVAHENLLLLDLLGFPVAEADLHLERSGVCGVPCLALLLIVFRLLVHGVVDKAKLQIPGVVSDGVHVFKDLSQARLQKPLVGTLLDLQQIGHLPDLLGARKTLSQGFAIEDIFWHWCTLLISSCKRPAALLKSIVPVLIKSGQNAILCTRR